MKPLRFNKTEWHTWTRVAIMLLSATSLFSADDGPHLRLLLRPTENRYCQGDAISGALQLHCRLRFVNDNSRPILINVNAGSVLEITAVPKGVRLDATVEPYRLLVTNVVFPGEPVASPRPGSDIVIVRPSKSFQTRQTVALPITSAAGRPGFLTSGDYSVQIVVMTWPGSAEGGAQLRKRWQSWGYLWTDPIRSEPIQVTVDAKRKLANCD